MVVELELFTETRGSRRWFGEVGGEHFVPDGFAFCWLDEKQRFGDVVDVELVGNVGYGLDLRNLLGDILEPGFCRRHAWSR
jgi:hypothetical protein